MDMVLNPNRNYYINDLFGWIPVSNKTQAMINCYINSDREYTKNKLRKEINRG